MENIYSIIHGAIYKHIFPYTAMEASALFKGSVFASSLRNEGDSLMLVGLGCPNPDFSGK